jgi:penicillin-binding protein 2
VVLDVRTGGVLAIASAPRFDPQGFSSGDPDAIGKARLNPDRPLFHRAIQMELPPGSVFKVVTALAVLSSGEQQSEHGDPPVGQGAPAGVSPSSARIDPEATVPCRGYLMRPDRLRCALFRREGIGHAEVNLSDALMESCNVYFFHVAPLLGPEPILDWGDRLGLGRASGIDLPYEQAGRLPRPGDRQPTGERVPWELADTRAIAIGQGRLQTTPIQLARAMAAIANGGYLVTPHVIHRVADSELADRPPPPVPIPGWNDTQGGALRRSLVRVVSDPRGTAHEAVHCAELAIAGKTGTAEAGPGRADHAWFAAFAPADAPRYAIAVAIEHGGDGGEVAGPIARRLSATLLGRRGENSFREQSPSISPRDLRSP